ncbi:MAG: integrase arm-type DNA-binding domain-containing protein [Burkholderiaceae bacterium]|nr:integrase arm-type DNA-binding domain-containing protein [Burkholderiaceae bacterium]
MKLNDKKVQSLIKAGRPGKYTDGYGLVLTINKTGGAYWQWRTTGPTGKETTVSYGTYPLVSLAEAREKHRDAKRMKLDGQNPVAARQQAKVLAMIKAGDTWGDAADEWVEVMTSRWSATHLATVKQRISKYLGPLKRRPLTEITSPEILSLLRKIEDRGHIETTKRARVIIGQVFQYAMALGKVKQDPSAPLVKVLKTAEEKHHSAITDPVKLGHLIRAIRSYTGSEVVRKAMVIQALTFQRPGEVRGMRWDELDLDAGMWTIPAVRMKSTRAKKATGEPHLVPLSSQAVRLLRDLHPVTAHLDLVFPGQRGQGRCISENAVRVALRVDSFPNLSHF